MYQGTPYSVSLYWADATWPGKYCAVPKPSEDRLAMYPAAANCGAQVTSPSTTSSPVPAWKRCSSWVSWLVDEASRLKTWTLMFGYCFSKPAIAAFVACPSAPRPWVANTIVCCAFAEVCAVGALDEEHAVAAPSRAARAVRYAVLRARRPGCAVENEVMRENTSQVGSAAPLRRYRRGSKTRRGEIGCERVIDLCHGWCRSFASRTRAAARPGR